MSEWVWSIGGIINYWRKVKYPEKTLLLPYLIHHKCHMDCRGVEPRAPR
jgi:hypothetical protein